MELDSLKGTWPCEYHFRVNWIDDGVKITR